MGTETQTEVTRIGQNIANTYAVLKALGADMPMEQNSDNLAQTAGSAKAVLYSKQSLAKEQKAQARANIEAVSIVVQNDSNNLVPTAINSNGEIYNGCGYKNGIRLNSSGEIVELYNACVTGFIPHVKDSTLVIEGARSEITYHGHYIATYNEAFELTLVETMYNLIENAKGTISYTDDNLRVFEIDTSKFTTQKYVTAFSNAKYIRVSMNPCLGEDAKVSVKEG